LLIFAAQPPDVQQRYQSQNTLAHQMLPHLKSLLGDFILVADRGFGHAWRILEPREPLRRQTLGQAADRGFGHAWTIRYSKKLGIDFVLRIKEDVRIYAAGKSALAKDFLPPGRGRKFYPDAICHATEKLRYAGRRALNGVTERRAES